MFPELTVYRFRLWLEVGPRKEFLPPYLGSTFRGVFAASFRRLVCVTDAPTCDGCLLMHRCSYPYLFETPPPQHIPEFLQKRFREAPRPYVLEVPLTYAGETELELGLVLVGRAVDFLPYVIYVLEAMGKPGLGRARVPYLLKSVTDGSRPDGAVIFQAEKRVLSDDFHAITLADLVRAEDAEVGQVTLTFLTPLRIKKFGGYQKVEEARITFSVLMDLLLGRVEALSFFHCGGQWDPVEQLRGMARQVQVVSKQLSFQSLERYSNRQQRKLPLHGFVGTITFAGPLAAFLPLLRLGEYLHIGAGTAFGLGRYRLTPALSS